MNGTLLRLCLAATFATCAVTAAPARELVGTGFVNNKIVQLFDDGTWEYLSKPLPAGCLFVTEAVQLCDETRRWRVAGGPKYAFNEMFSNGSVYYAGIIAEDIGTSSGVNLEYMISVALEGAAEVSGVGAESVPVHSIEEEAVDGHSGNRVVYGSVDTGVKFVFANTIIVEQNLTMQAMTWTVGSEFTEAHEKAHEDFISKIRIDYEDPVQ